MCAYICEELVCLCVISKWEKLKYLLSTLV